MAEVPNRSQTTAATAATTPAQACRVASHTKPDRGRVTYKVNIGAASTANGYDDFDKIRFWTTPVSSCPAGNCVPYYRWVSDYIGVIGGR